MRVLHRNILAATLILFFIAGLPHTISWGQYENASVSYNDFYENLAPYGQWIEDPTLGYVWAPEVDASFRPYYTNGYWVVTDYGNTWVSDYPWGWACFHYGRWTYDAYYGWLWIPGTNWGPAWVSWRSGEGFYGWAPLGPGYDFKMDYYCPNDWWIFIPPKYLYTGQYYRYWTGPRNNKHLVGNSEVINNVYENNHVTYVSGPRPRQVQDITHQPVQVLKVVNSKNNLRTHISHDVIKMYRPAEIRPAAAVEGHRPSPPNVVSAPQPVSNKPQAVSGKQPQAVTDFRVDVPKTRNANDAVGTRPVEPPRQAPTQNNTTNPYEWDVNRPVAQPGQMPRQEAPRPVQQIQQPLQVQQPQQQAPQTNRNVPQPQPVTRPHPTAAPAAPVNTARPQPTPQPTSRPQQAAPAPQNAPHQEIRR